MEAYPKLTHKRVFTHDAAWRAIVEEVDDDALAAPLTGDEPQAGHITGIDRVYHQFFGLRGENDSLYRRGDTTVFYPEDVDDFGNPIPAHTDPRDGAFDQTPLYQLSDPQLSVVAVVSDGDVSNPAGRTLDTLEYDAYGNVRRGLRADTDRSGKVEVADINNFLSLWFAGTTPGDPNKFAADADENGVVATADIFAFLNFWFADNTAFATGAEPRRARLGTGLNGVGSGDNPYGYCGYYFDAETAAAQILGPDTRSGGSAGGGGLYYVRHRVYDSYTGRWLTRDPAGFVDGMNLYEYCSGYAISCYDPTGLGWKSYRGYKNGVPGTYHHYYRKDRYYFLGFFPTLTVVETYVPGSTTFTPDGEVQDDKGQIAYQRRVQGTLSQASRSVQNTTCAAGTGAMFVIMVLTPGPEELILTGLLKGVKYLKYVDGKWIKVLVDGTEEVADAATASKFDDAVKSGKLKPGDVDKAADAAKDADKAADAAKDADKAADAAIDADKAGDAAKSGKGGDGAAKGVPGKDLPGKGDGWTKLKGDQGWRDAEGNIWKKDMLHKDHYDIMDKKGNKIREVDFQGRELWPNGPKNKSK